MQVKKLTFWCLSDVQGTEESEFEGDSRTTFLFFFGGARTFFHFFAGEFCIGDSEPKVTRGLRRGDACVTGGGVSADDWGRLLFLGLGFGTFGGRLVGDLFFIFISWAKNGREWRSEWDYGVWKTNRDGLVKEVGRFFFFLSLALTLSLSLFWLNSVNEEMKRKVTWRQGNKSGH